VIKGDTADIEARIDPNAFVASLYHTILGREPDTPGLQAYVRAMQQGTSHEELLRIFLESDEFAVIRHRAALLDIGREIGRAGTLEEGRENFKLSRFPQDYTPPGEAGRCYLRRLNSGFLDRYCAGPVLLDVGFSGYDNPDRKTALPGAIGVDLDYPGYDGRRLPFEDGSVDTIFSSHCLEHILWDHETIRDWYRVTKFGGHIVCIVPSQALYEKKRFLPSCFNEDHKRMYTPASLVRSFEEALQVNTYRVRHLAENDYGFNYQLGPGVHSDGAYEIELVIEKITKPDWDLA
jgi:SAM-dependent methyltransferase